MTISIASVEELIKKYETELQSTIANHATLAGGMNALKMLLNIAAPVVEVLEPATSTVEEVVEAVDTAVNEITPQ